MDGDMCLDFLEEVRLAGRGGGSKCVKNT